MKFEQRQWDQEAEQVFDSFLVPDRDRPRIIEEVNSGQATLWKISGESWQTWLITCLEQQADGTREMVLEAVTGRHVRPILQRLLQHYRAHGVDSVRFETPHPEKVAARLVAPLGFKRAATTFRMEL